MILEEMNPAGGTMGKVKGDGDGTGMYEGLVLGLWASI